MPVSTFPQSPLDSNLQEDVIQVSGGHKSRHIVTPTDKNEEGYAETRPKTLRWQSTPISTYGERPLTLILGLTREFRWEFIIANVELSDIMACQQTYEDGSLIDVPDLIPRIMEIDRQDSSTSTVALTEKYHHLLRRFILLFKPARPR